ncbi:hypothetical protein K469DRAFT_564168 [Zopfia rhizophila CBS 207.26]|uniref:DNA (cytosine-5)-methyltransferase 1 replication foci domain-containing protein n=1 Tax=Zopfia rhizophila CBS 207.26 TaxID=1314779 RepID=A0A6A6EE56_9PEZI|nr:hypothetical protein K469DRAFT_564168 [Zopfia rhizophila CBS 207.26]
MLTPELDVLKPINPSITNSDDYEIYTLSNAQVFHASNGRLANLLSAYADTPLRVEGKLDPPDRSQQKYLVRKPYRAVEIKITDVTRFSYGQTEDGEILIWALGEAGWFELRPARAYKEIYRDMVQAVEILYFVTDIYNEPRKRGGGPSAELIFQEYAEDDRFPCNGPAQAAQLFSKYRPFLIMCMLNQAQGIGWSNTPIYRYFKKQFPKDFENARGRMSGKPEEKPEKVAKSDTVPQKPKVLKAKDKVKQIPMNAPKKDENWWEAAAIFEFMQKIVNQGVVHIGHVTLERVAKLLVKRYEIDDIDVAINVIRVHASNLCYMIEHRRRKNIQYFIDEPIYQELSSGYDLSAAEIRRAEQVELRLRKDHSTLEEDIGEESDSGDSVATPLQRRRPNKGKFSALRPKSGKFSGKGKGVKRGKGKGKKPNINMSSDEGSEEAQGEDDIEIDTPTQALSPGKRKHTSTHIDTNPRKRAASQSAEPESPTISSESEITDTHTEPLPLRWRSGNISAKSSSPALLPPVVSTPLPSHAANAPGDSWICTFDGCSQKVYGASTDTGRTLIKEHLQDHATKGQAQIELVMSEEQKLRLPVNNLIKRIREMTEHQQPLFPNLGSAATAVRPAPIERSI